MKNIFAISLLVFAIFFVVSNISFAQIVEGDLTVLPSPTSNGGTLNIKLSGFNSATLPDNTVTRLWIDNSEGAGVQDFNTWVTVGALKSGVQRTVSCTAFGSYTPGKSVNLTLNGGKRLIQKMYLTYEGKSNLRSYVVTYTTDCRAASKITVKTLKLLPDFKKINNQTYMNMGGEGNSASFLKVNEAGIALNTLFFDSYLGNNDFSKKCIELGITVCVAYNTTAKGNKASARLFSLSADPSNPQINFTSDFNINSNEDAAADFNSALTVLSVAYSPDGTYAALRSSKGALFFWNKSGGRYRQVTPESSGASLSDFTGIVKSGTNTYFIGNSSILNMTNFYDQPLIGSSGGVDTVNRRSDPKDMPANTPTIKDTGNNDRSVVLGDTFAKVFFKNGTNPVSILRFYTLNQTAPAAEYILSEGVNSLVGAAVTGLVTSDGKKYVIIGSGSKIFVYEVAIGKITPIIEDAVLPVAYITSGSLGLSSQSNIVGVVVDGKPAVMTLNGASSVIPRIFLMSDLAAGLVKNIAPSVSSPVSKVSSAAAYIKGNTTYVYTLSRNSRGDNQIAVWDLSGVR